VTTPSGFPPSTPDPIAVDPPELCRDTDSRWCWVDGDCYWVTELCAELPHGADNQHRSLGGRTW